MRENGISGNLIANDAGQAEAAVRVDIQETHCCTQSFGGDRTCKASRMDVLIVMRMQGEVAEERSCEFRVLVFSPSQERSGHLIKTSGKKSCCQPTNSFMRLARWFFRTHIAIFVQERERDRFSRARERASGTPSRALGHLQRALALMPTLWKLIRALGPL